MPTEIIIHALICLAAHAVAIAIGARILLRSDI